MLNYFQTFLTFSRLKFDNSLRSDNQILYADFIYKNTRSCDFSLLSLKINTNLAMFGESQTSLANYGNSRSILSFAGQRFLIESPVKKTGCLSVSELSVFRGLNIRNQWGYTNTNTRILSLLKKACEKQASISALRLRSRSGV